MVGYMGRTKDRGLGEKKRRLAAAAGGRWKARDWSVWCLGKKWQTQWQRWAEVAACVTVECHDRHVTTVSRGARSK